LLLLLLLLFVLFILFLLRCVVGVISAHCPIPGPTLGAIEQVPILELEFRSVPIDMTFAQLPIPIIPKNFNILDDDILRGVDNAMVLSLNGPRATELIRQLVPECV
jgi:hypothetical protein